MLATHRARSVCIWSFSGSYFPTFGLNTKIYSVNLHNQSEFGKIQTTKAPNTHIFGGSNIPLQNISFWKAFPFKKCFHYMQISQSKPIKQGTTRILLPFINRSSRPEMFCKKGVLRNFTNSQENTCARDSFQNKVAGLRLSFFGNHLFILNIFVRNRKILFDMAEKHSKNLDPKVHFYLFLLKKHKQNHNVKNLVST